MTTTAPAEPGRQRLEAAAHRVPGAELLILHRGDERAAQLLAQRLHLGGHLLAPVPDDDRQVLGRERRDGRRGVPEQRDATDRVHHLGQR